MTIPEDCTDDMNIELRFGTIKDLVEFVIVSELKEVAPSKTMEHIQTQFGVSPEDAELAWDRVLGGIVRARTGNLANCPVRAKDPIAWESFQRGVQDQKMAAQLRP